MPSPKSSKPEPRPAPAWSVQGLVAGVDEDTRGIDPDPLVNRFDMGKEPLDYAKARSETIEALWPGPWWQLPSCWTTRGPSRDWLTPRH